MDTPSLPSRLNRRIIRWYPAEFREQFGDEIEQVLRTAERLGERLGARTSADLLIGAASQHWRHTMSTTPTAPAAHPVAVAAFVFAALATLGGLFLTIAWIGFAPLAILPAAAAYVSGRRAGLLTPTSATRRAAGYALLVVLVVAIALAVLVWGGSRG